MSSDQHKTMLSEASGYVPEYSAQAHSGSQELAVHGLSSDEVAKLTAAGKVNAQNNKSSRTLWSIMRAHLFTVFNLVLGLCGLVVILYQRWADLLFLFAVVANVIIGFVQEYKAKLELDRISLLDRSPITAVRDGAMIEVPMESLVEGDVVVLKRGDQVPADAVVLTSDSLELDESLLTGENDPIPKRPGDMVLSASSVLGGTGRVLLSAVGSESRASKISDEARQFSRIQSELRDALDRVVRWITFGLAIIIPIVLWGQVRAAGGLEIVNRDGLWENVAIAVVSSVASMIPQGLALMTTLAFAAAAVALGRKHNILVQEQPAVEVLARVDTVCFDKTGTLTEGGVIFDSVRPLTTPAEAKAPDENQAWRASLPQGWDQALAWFGHDENANPTAAALTGGFEQAPTEQVSGIVPFSSALRFSAIEFKSSGAWLLGAPEALLNQGTEERERARELASLGLRTMVLAHASAVVRNDDGDPVQHIPTDHTPVLFVIFRENVRSDAPEIVDYFNRQGVTLKVFSGDNPYTVQAAAKTAGMDISAGAIDASTLPEDGPELAEAAATHNIFGRVSPEQKKNMVISLKEQGHVVAMTGDGINDALALKHANLGIAMGNAAPATKAVSRLVLLDGKFSSLPAALEQGRQVIANIEMVANLFLTKTGFAILLGVVFGLMGLIFPFLPRQYSTADFLIVGASSFALALLPNSRRYVPGFLRRVLNYTIPNSIIVVAMLVLVNLAALFIFRPEGDIRQVQTASFITLVIMGLWNLAAVARPLNTARMLLFGALLSIFFAALLVPLLVKYHQFEMPSTELLMLSIGAGVLGAVLIEVNAHRSRRWQKRSYPELEVASLSFFPSTTK